MNRRELLEAALAAFAAGLARPAVAQAAVGPVPVVTLGSVAVDIPAEMTRRMGTLSDYLARSTGLQVRFRPSPNMASAVEELGAGRTQIAYLSPMAYLEARQHYGVQPLVAQTSQGRPFYSLAIVVKAGSGLRVPADLRGRRFAFGDERALLQKAAIDLAGLKPADFASYAYLRHFDNIAKAVLAGDFDAGILKDTQAEAYKDKGLVTISSTPPLPAFLFAVHPAMPPARRAQLRNALLALKRTTPDKFAVLDTFDSACDGFVPTDDKVYDSVRRLVRPFRK